MNRKFNFTKLQAKKNGVKLESAGTSNQQTISKFFVPQKKNVDAFDQVKNESSLKRPSLESPKVDEIPEKKLKTMKLSEGTVNKLLAFSIDNPQKSLNKTINKENQELTSSNFKQIEDDLIPVKKKHDFTPLEKQFLEIKEKNPDTILFIECGYKYRFFGKDAEVVAKELNIFCHLDHNFQTASIPTHRLFVHVRRLVAKGYKVGVVKQTETAALKATGENKNRVFTRELSAIYTKATMIGEDVDSKAEQELLEMEDKDDSSYIMSIAEFDCRETGFNVGIIACRPVTGEMIYDYFTDKSTRSELEARFLHLQPSEVVLRTDGLTETTLHLLENYAANAEYPVRIEKQPNDVFEYSSAFTAITKFFEDQSGDKTDMQRLFALPAAVVSCIAALLNYLKTFHLEKLIVLGSRSIVKYSEESKYLKLNATTIRNLEIFNNLTDSKTRGTLFWYLNRTQTAFGERLLKKWISYPLQDVREIENRQEAVAEFIESKSPLFSALKGMLKKMPDIEKQLGCTFHNRCSTSSFYLMLKTYSAVNSNLSALKMQIYGEVKSEYLKKILQDLASSIEGIVDEYLNNLNEGAAREQNKTKIFKDVTPFPEIVSSQEKIKNIIQKLKDLRGSICNTLRLPGFEYSTVAGQEFLIEVRNSQMKGVPKSWNKISCTKQVGRFRSPEVETLVQELSCAREELSLACKRAWTSYIDGFNKNFYQFSRAVKHLATLDCITCLAEVAKQTEFCRPLFVEYDQVLHIEYGCHPIVSQLLPEGKQYIANDTMLDGGKRCMIITGPNMGGKSCYMRQVALIVLMAHIGSYVPAKAAVMSVVDGIFIRMGANDEMFKNRSTFLLEMQEAAEIMNQATSKSLVILDELGRGTSTHDGAAIAFASLDYFLNEKNCFLLFVTHYTILTEFARKFPESAKNFCMSFFTEETDNCDEESVIFLYKLTETIASGSFGLNVAKLAGIPSSILSVAAAKSKRLEEEFQKKAIFSNIFKNHDNGNDFQQFFKNMFI